MTTSMMNRLDAVKFRDIENVDAAGVEMKGEKKKTVTGRSCDCSNYVRTGTYFGLMSFVIISMFCGMPKKNVVAICCVVSEYIHILVRIELICPK
jgi:hypothetical protein